MSKNREFLMTKQQHSQLKASLRETWGAVSKHPALFEKILNGLHDDFKSDEQPEKLVAHAALVALYGVMLDVVEEVGQ